MSNLTLSHLAELIGAELVGDPNYAIEGLAALDDAGAKQLSFLSSKKYLSKLTDTKAGAVIVPEGLDQLDSDQSHTANWLICHDPYAAYAKISRVFATQPKPSGLIHPTAVVDPSAEIGAQVSIGAHCVVEAGVSIADHCEIMAGCFIGARSKLGESSLLHPNTTLYHDVVIGKKAIIHSGTVLGSDGFGFAPTQNGWQKIHQLGGVSVGCNVEIGANTAIDRGALQDTLIGDGVIIDNHVHIAHNVEIGERSAIAGRVAIAGSTRIGKRCTFGGCVAVNGHIEIVDDVHINGGTVVTKSILKAGSYASGTPMQEVRQWRKNFVRAGQLDDWVCRIKKLDEQKS